MNSDSTFPGRVHARGDPKGRRLKVAANRVLTDPLSSIVGGDRNTHRCPCSTIGGGHWNSIQPGFGCPYGAGDFNNGIGTNTCVDTIGGHPAVAEPLRTNPQNPQP